MGCLGRHVDHSLNRFVANVAFVCLSQAAASGTVLPHCPCAHPGKPCHASRENMAEEMRAAEMHVRAHQAQREHAAAASGVSCPPLSSLRFAQEGTEEAADEEEEEEMTDGEINADACDELEELLRNANEDIENLQEDVRRLRAMRNRYRSEVARLKVIAAAAAPVHVDEEDENYNSDDSDAPSFED